MSSTELVRRRILRATERAKSDVANKLVSMLLHAISRTVADRSGTKVSHPEYAEAVLRHFGGRCAFCEADLAEEHAVVEHLDAMNRTRLGLHVPGNVAMACRRCNKEKRNDDQARHGGLAATGWESFLSHDGSSCAPACKTCLYWRERATDPGVLTQQLAEARRRIGCFREEYSEVIGRVEVLRPLIRKEVEELYREGQRFAVDRISEMTAEIAGRLDRLG